MRRHPDLLQLSREHHGALKLARAARLAAESGDPERVAGLAQRVVSAFSDELEPHFIAEEAELLPSLAAAGESALVERTLAEHVELRNLVGRLQQPKAVDLLRFADLLAAHVRFEERTLFETAQARVGAFTASH